MVPVMEAAISQARPNARVEVRTNQAAGRRDTPSGPAAFEDQGGWFALATWRKPSAGGMVARYVGMALCSTPHEPGPWGAEQVGPGAGANRPVS